MSIFPKETLDTVFRSLKDPGHDFTLPYISRDEGEIIAKGEALFHDQSYSGMLNPDQSTMMILLMGKQGKNARFTKKLDLILTEEAETVVNEIHKANSDIFGVGRKLIAYHNNVWRNKNWSEDYRKVKFHTKVEVKIISTGILQ